MRTLLITLMLSFLLAGPLACGDDLERVSDEPPAQMPEGHPEIPSAGASGQLVVFWQASGMGDVEMNLNRWISSVRRPDGTPARREDAAVARREINGLEVVTLDITGDLGGDGMGGAHASGATKNVRLLCAIAGVPGGVPYYIKANGPASTMKAAQADWEAFLTSLRIDDAGKLKYELPAGWVPGKPTSAMRYAQATIPAAD
jgi:hypothetical protein